MRGEGGDVTEDPGDEGLEILGAEGGHGEVRFFGGVWWRKGRKEGGDERREGCKDDGFLEWFEGLGKDAEYVGDGGDGIFVPLRVVRCTWKVVMVMRIGFVEKVYVPGIVVGGVEGV